ncbi:lipopolysaccharide biosynthesis protein [Burkholderia cepacia]|uniref:lipopolysaccharide biosynthesis protein n=1 Tax=Burkholderia cepacia TaxID=292 RepID=UPI0012AA02B3|nr:hypothetical protein [Burkholderia cepacia]QFS40573.1 lysaccharide biosynthesis protein [Burkholderia cepacia]
MARSGLGLAAGYAISLVGGLGSLVLYAHTLDAQDYGRLAVYLASVEAFQGVLFQWHRLAMVRFWAGREQSGWTSFLTTSLITGAVMAGVVIVVLLAVLAAGFPVPPEWIAVVAMGLAKSAALYAQELSRAAGAGLRYACGSVLLTLGTALAGAAAYRIEHSIVAVLVTSTVVFVLTAVACGWPGVMASLGGRFVRADLAAMARYGLPLIPVFVATTALTRLDRPILAHFESATTVGVYAAAATLITNVVTAACLLVVTPTYPWLLREKTLRNDDAYRRLHARTGLLMLAGVLAIATALYCARDVAFPLLLGRTLGGAAEPIVLPLLAIAVISAFRTHFFDQAYHLFSRTKVLMTINIATLGVAVVGLYAGARIGGLAGMLAGLAIAHGCSLLLSAALSRSFIDFGRLTSGIGVLSLICVTAGAAGSIVGHARLPGEIANLWQGALAAAVAIAVFVVGMVLANVGMCRSSLSRKS